MDTGYINENYGRKRLMEKRTQRFAEETLKMLDTLPVANSTRIISYQLGKSASSIGANYREANGAESRADFSHKIGLVLKEAMETEYWLSILSSLYPAQERIKDLLAESSEFVRIFQRVRTTLNKPAP